jgi:hypothetical protein
MPTGVSQHLVSWAHCCRTHITIYTNTHLHVNKLVLGFCASLSLNPSCLFILSGCNFIFTASLVSWCVCVAGTSISWNLIWWLDLVLCSASADLSSSYRHCCHSCPLYLVSMVQSVCPAYTFPYSHGILQTPETFSPRASFADLMWELFLAGMCGLSLC